MRRVSTSTPPGTGSDTGRADWRTFRLDRIDDPYSLRRRFVPRTLPAPDAATYLTRSFASAHYRYTARITVRLPAASLRARLFAPIPGDIDAHGTDECTVRLSADSAELVTQYVAALAALGAALDGRRGLSPGGGQ